MTHDDGRITSYKRDMIDLEFSFTGEVWLWEAKTAAWHFVTLPEDMSEDIKAFTKHLARGFKSVKLEVSIGETHWKTSIFPSKERGAYILPIKKSVRIAEDITVGSSVTFNLHIPT